MTHTYSPTQTTTYMVCPVKWYNAYKAGEHGKGLVPAVTPIQAWDRLIGSAGHMMLKVWYLTGNMDDAISAGQAEVDASIGEMLAGNVLKEVPSATQLHAEVVKLGQAYQLRYPMEAWQRVVAVESLLTTPATCKLDLVVVDYDGEPAVVEHKFPGPKARLDSQAGRWRMAYQPLNYCWAVDEAKQALGLTKPCRRVIMNFVQRMGKIDPAKHLQRYPIEVKEHLLEIHKQQAQRLWTLMAQAEGANNAGQEADEGGKAGRVGMWPNWEACDTRWGRCEFIEYCESGWDEAIERGRYYSKGAGNVQAVAAPGAK